MTQEDIDYFKGIGFHYVKVETKDEIIFGLAKREVDFARIILSMDNVILIPYHRILKVTVIFEDEPELDKE